MENFEFCVPTDVIFGKGRIERLPGAIGAFGKKVLLAYGGGSVKRMGLHDEVMRLLDGCEVHELSGIAPNPRFGSVREGAETCREHGIDVLLAVGGGSVFGVEAEDDMEAARQTIAELRAFFEGLGVPTSFGELGVGPEHFDEMAEHAVEAEGLAYAWVPLAPADVRAIYEMCL